MDSLDAFWEMKENNVSNPNTQIQKQYASIHMPHRTATGFVIAMFSGIFGFGIVWHIYWMIALGLLGIFATAMARTFNTKLDYYLHSDDIIAFERLRSQQTASQRVEHANEDVVMA